jgi:hypothetical protein
MTHPPGIHHSATIRSSHARTVKMSHTMPPTKHRMPVVVAMLRVSGEELKFHPLAVTGGELCQV